MSEYVRACVVCAYVTLRIAVVQYKCVCLLDWISRQGRGRCG